MMQNLIVALVVIACAGYVAWILMPSALRRALAQQALRLPLPPALSARLQRATQASTGCGSCGDCGPKPAKGATHPIHFHRQPRP